jgi:hypothetical protein
MRRYPCGSPFAVVREAYPIASAANRLHPFDRALVGIDAIVDRHHGASQQNSRSATPGAAYH